MLEKHLWNLSACQIIQSWNADSPLSLSEIDASESSDGDESDYISFTMWICEDKKIKKVTKCLEHKEFYNDWERRVIELKERIHRKRIQIAAYNSCKAYLKQGEAILHVNYSGLCKNKQQDEIQSPNLGQSSFSLFTTWVYHLDDSGFLIRRTITVSESSDHSQIAPLTCIDFFIKEVEKHIALTKVILWSDGCAAQFRSRFAFNLISTYRPDLLIDWHYHEVHHSKGLDGTG